MPHTDLSWRPPPLVEGFYTSEVQAVDRRPIRTFLPTGYETNYPYPLLVFFHGHGGDEEQVLRLAPRLSRRNYICIGLRGPESVGPRPDGRCGYGWGQDGSCDATIEEYVLRAVEQTRRNYHVHSERVYLAGFCEGATLAYRLGLSFPERFAGVLSLNGIMPRRGCPLMRLTDLRTLRVFIGHGIANAVIPLPLARRDHLLLYTAGLPVRMHTYPTTHRIHPDMLRDVNRWIMEHVNADE
ncbi:MAG TPA: PHB depolymerase family esterase [Gemmataceae bacterium]|nr:PHB depolymerase family esterase [Gemmataceae bacterium]